MSKITVTTIAGLTSGGDANKVKIESGDTLEVVNGSQTINRTGDGDLIAFQKGGADSGSISIESSGTAFDGEASHAGLKMFLGGIGLRQNGADVDNTIDLGWTGGRVKDIYLGGGLYVGGTGAANKFEDYEEGTWTPDIRNADNANTFSTEIGRYVKIGAVVYIYFYSDGGNTGGGGGLQVRGLPFTYTSNDYIFGARGMAGVNNSSSSTRRNLIVNFNSAGTDTALLYYGGTFLSDTLSYVSGFAVYKTDS